MKHKLALILAATLMLSHICACSSSTVIPNNSADIPKGSVYKGEAIEINADCRYITDMELYCDTLYMLAYSFNSDEAAIPTYHIFTYDTVNKTLGDTTYPQINSAYELAVSESGVLVQGTVFDEKYNKSTAAAWCIRDGEVEWEISLDDITEFDNIGNNTHVGALGDTWFISEAYTVMLFSSDGKLITKEALPANAVCMFASGGTMQICGYDTRGDNMFCCTITEGGTVTESTEWLDVLDKIPFNRIIHGSDRGVYYLTESALVEYSTADSSHTAILDLVSSGIYGASVTNMAVHSSGEVYVCGGTTDGLANAVRRFSPVSEDELNEKQVIRVAYIEDGTTTVPLAAIKFNQSQSSYEIICEEYGSADMNSHYQSVLTQFDLDIASGNAGDIIILDSPEDVKKYSDKGILADLYSLNTASLDPDNIYGCVRDVCEADGKLYSIPREFSLSTLVTKSENAADFGDWRMNDYLRIAGTIDNMQSMLMSNGRDYIMNRLLPYAVCDCIDTDSNTCSFDNEMFISFLEYLRTLPEESTVPDTKDVNRYITDEILLYEHYIGSYAEIAQLRGVYGRDTDYTIVGYPSEDDGAAKFTGICYLAVNEQSNVKEGAAAFIEYLLSADTVININKGMRHFPSLKSTTESWNESEMQYYYTFDINDTNGYSCSPKPTQETETTICVAMNEDFIAETYAFLDSVHIVKAPPEDLLDIVNEEIRSFIAGSSSASDCAKYINNRVSTYLAELG